MNRLPKSVDTATRASNSTGSFTPAVTRAPLDHGNSGPVAVPVRNDLRRGSRYVGKSYLGRARRSTTGSRPAMFRIS